MIGHLIDINISPVSVSFLSIMQMHDFFNGKITINHRFDLP